MKKKWSQRLLLICAVWQFIDGILTIILGFAGLNRIPELQGYAQFVPVATITGLVGTAFLLSGLVNLLLARYYLRRPAIALLTFMGACLHQGDSNRSKARAGAQPSGNDGWAGGSFSGISVMVASVSSRILATETAFSRAIRTTLVGSMMPASYMST